MDIYDVELDDGNVFKLAIQLALSRPDDPIKYITEDETRYYWHDTPFKTSDAQHDPETAAKMVAEYLSAKEGISANVVAMSFNRKVLHTDTMTDEERGKLLEALRKAGARRS